MQSYPIHAVFEGVSGFACICLAVLLLFLRRSGRGHEDYLLPTMDEWEVFPREAVAVAKKAIEQGVARLSLSEAELYRMAESKIGRARDEVGLLMDKGIIEPYKEPA
jgi:malate dehydrogenase (oxaloacetate-decarboxylating)